MNNAKLKTRQNRVIVFIGLAIFLVTAIFIGVLSSRYYLQVEQTVRDESEDHIMEISHQMENNISRNMNDNFSALSTVATALQGSINLELTDLMAQLTELKEHWKYEKVLLIDGNSNAYSETGDKTYINNDLYLQTVISGRKASMSASEKIGDDECVIFAIPIEFAVILPSVEPTDKPLTVTMLALAATYTLENFDKILAMSAFEEQADAHIIRRDGTIVIRSSLPNIFEPGYNMLNTIESRTNDVAAVDLIRRNISNGLEGFAMLDIADDQNGQAIQTYMSYITLDSGFESEQWYLATLVPLSVVNVKSMLLLRLTMLVCGIIGGIFVILVAAVLFVSFKSRNKLVRIAYIDDVTGGNTFKLFYEVANKILKNAREGEYALLYTNIEKFKLLNEQFGREKCDEMLKSISNAICGHLDEDECIGRQFADHFCILIKFNGFENLTERIKLWKSRYNEFSLPSDIQDIYFTVQFGVRIIEELETPLNQIIDRAKLSLTENPYSVTDNVKVFAYSDKIRDKLVREKYLEDRMERALSENEFQVYLQPKYNTSTDTIGGAEALVRWYNDKDGMIYPNEFIPLFEKNGFIRQLDICVFKQVCKLLRKWIDEGKKPLKISVNCSREHLKVPNFLDAYVEIAKQYDLPREYLEIEFTENIVFEDVKYFSDIIDLIHESGFGCSLDDFGSGYSSLSMIQDIPVDTIKLDKVFFFNRTLESTERTEAVVASIINMSKALKVITVAEGVEEKSQVAMLKRLGCDLIQGFYYSKPLPIKEFEKLAFKDSET